MLFPAGVAARLLPSPGRPNGFDALDGTPPEPAAQPLVLAYRPLALRNGPIAPMLCSPGCVLPAGDGWVLELDPALHAALVAAAGRHTSWRVKLTSPTPRDRDERRFLASIAA